MKQVRVMSWFCVVLATPWLLQAQTLRGAVTDGAGPVAGVVLLVVDTGGHVVSRGISRQDGQYVITLSRTGTFRIRTLRLGYRPSVSGPVRLITGEDRTVDVAVSGIPARLERVVTTTSTQCQHVRGDTAALPFEVLDQIRTALYAIEVTARPNFSRALNVRMTEFERVLDPWSGSVVRQEARIRQGLTSSPWATLSADAVHDSGYARTSIAGVTTYFAPDIAVLVSPEFIQDHCFRVARDSGSPEISLQFEPTRSRRRLTEIRGSMHVDVASSALRRVEFEYVNAPQELEGVRAGGHLDFVRLASEAWLISGWSIRLPSLEVKDTEIGGFGRMRRRERRVVVAGLLETGGELALVTRGRDTLYASRPLSVVGRVVDSTSGRGVPAASLRIRGTELVVTTAGDGAFALPGVLPGAYVLEVRARDTEPWGVQIHRLNVTRLGATHVVRVPSAATLMRAACGGTAIGALVGRVIRRDSTPVAGANVHVSWPAGDMIAGRDTITDVRGFFRVCDVPLGSAASAQVVQPGLSATSVYFAITLEQPIGVIQLIVDSTSVATAMLHGRILDATSGRPLQNAAIQLKRAGRATVSDTEGRYRFARVDSGPDTVMVRRMGFRLVELPIRLRDGESLERNAALSKVATLDTVRVRERSLPATFYDHQRLGLGQFLTRDHLERHEHRRLSEVLEGSMRGVGLFRYMGNQAYLIRRRGSLSLTSDKCFELEGISVSRCGCFPAIFLDGVAIFNGRLGPVPNINLFSLMSIEAIEFYAGPSQTPGIYSNLDSACGVLVIHTRRF